MDRRRFLVASLAGAFACPLAAEAQAGKVRRIGAISVLAPATPPGQGPFWDRMRELGWVYEQNVVIEHRMFGTDSERIPGIAKELIGLGTDVFLVNNGSTVERVQTVTRTIPIVTTAAGDLVATGRAASLARPGGNVTGLQVMQTDLVGKHLALLKETIPGLSRLGVLAGDQWFSEAKMHTKNFTAAWIHEITARAPTLGLQPHVVIVSDGDGFERAFSAFKGQRTQALILYSSSLMGAYQTTVGALALTHRLPTICLDADQMKAGYLMSYGWDRRVNSRLVAEIVDKILRGEKAGDIPIQQPTTFRLVINLTTAKALGLTIPPSLLGRADQVIE